ncbi:uncharacterized protein LOC115415497 isoform X1 [Sphaeramia orbicularis]|uniref:uncharacterized protein LOC115415497 isoform X1 n=1 Tax=Sphaeramia orbicularis TaxID=375764 RepID=UPI00117F414F|nr:uncharacterized protein LOC115415497 isoform X1 [Sphaeramia orbicularis]
MGEFTWITLSLLFLQISAEVTEENVFVRNGSDATLPCGNVMDGQHECNGTTWNFVRKETAEELVGHGKIKPEFQSDRLAVTADCSLLIKNVTKEDANQYTCQQYRYNPIKGVHRYGGDAKVYLSVVTLTEHQDTDKRMFNCSVWTYKQCKHKVRWQFEKNNEKKYKQDSSTVDGICSNTTTCLGCKSKNSDSLTCEVTDTNQKVYPFPFKSSDQKTGEEKKVNVETTRVTPTTRTTTKVTAVENTDENKITTESPTISGFPDWAKFFIASGLAALLVTTVVLLIWNRKKGEKTQMGEGTVADPEDAVPYASVHFTKKARKAGAQRKNDDDDDDDDDAVTYSTVKASSSSAADSCDPSILYATVNKPK